MRETADIQTVYFATESDREARKITRKVLDNFWEDIQAVCSAPFLQLLDRGGYNESARLNRERIAKAVACGA
jgi:hypothetical protein